MGLGVSEGAEDAEGAEGTEDYSANYGRRGGAFGELGKEIDAWVLHARARNRFLIAKLINYARDWRAKGREFST
jgi:hypothetical protein